jgi:thiamine-phosphate pyrophosphorylase
VFLYYITDRKQLSADPEESIRLLLDRVRMAAQAGIDAIQLRERDLEARHLTELGLRAMELIAQERSEERRTRLLVNSRVDVAIACGADGVHLPSNDISAADARSVLVGAHVKDPLIGVSCHTCREVKLASSNGADFSVFGPVFAKAEKNSVPTDTAGLQQACFAGRTSTSRMPVIALGGVSLQNAGECLRVGAAGIAGIRLFQDGDVAETISTLRSLPVSLPSA